MAVDYSQYAQIYGGGNVNEAAAGVGAGIGKGFQAIPNVMDRLAQSQGEGLDDAFAPLLGLLSKKVDEWDDIGKIPSAGEAYMGWVNSMNPRQKRMARRKGILNPVAYKQQYDAQMEMYLPAIKDKFEAYRTMGSKTDKSMRDFLSTKPGLNQFFLANTSPEELALSPYFTPTKTWDQWWEGADKMEVAGAGYGAVRAAKIGRGLVSEGPKAYISGRTPRLVDPSKVVKKPGALGKAMGAKGFGSGFEKRIQKDYLKASRKQGSATKAYKAAEKLYKGKKLPFEKSVKGKPLAEAKRVATEATKKAKGKIGQGPIKAINKFIKKHGVKKFLGAVTKKLGWKGAAKLMGKGVLGVGLTASGIGTAAGLAMDAWTIKQLYDVVTSIGE